MNTKGRGIRYDTIFKFYAASVICIIALMPRAHGFILIFLQPDRYEKLMPN